MRYIVENLNTGYKLHFHAEDRKSAHEYGQHCWPGQPVAVYSEAEYTNTNHYRAEHNQIMDLLDSVLGDLPDSNYEQIIRSLINVAERVSALQTYFEDKQTLNQKGR